LRDQCAYALENPTNDVRAGKVGDRFFQWGFEEPVDRIERGAYAFTLAEIEIGSDYNKSVWECRIVVTRDLDIYYEVMKGKVPHELLSCALGGQ
jgi:hypothetical protein